MPNINIKQAEAIMRTLIKGGSSLGRFTVGQANKIAKTAIVKSFRSSIARDIPISPVNNASKHIYKEIEHIQIPSVISTSGTNQYDIGFMKVLTDIGNAILPDGSMAVDEDHKFDPIDIQLFIEAESTKKFSFCFLLHVREDGKTTLTNQNVAHSTGTTLEEKFDAILPDSGVGHDFRVISPWMHSNVRANNSTDNVNNYRGQINLLPLFMKIINEHFSTKETKDRIFDLIVVVVNYSASQTVTFTTMLCINGRMKLYRDAIL